MHIDSPLSNYKRFVKAVATNQVARFAPASYVKLTEQTGRGSGEGDAASVAGYFKECFDDYFRILGIAPEDIGTFLSGKTLLEYGPGDTPGVALLMAAYGADKIYCVDRFPLVAMSQRNRSILESLLTFCDGDVQVRGKAILADLISDPSGSQGVIQYQVTPSGLSGLHGEVDLVLSRAVLEHVNDLPATFKDMAGALKKGGRAVHQVDLKSHGLHSNNPLDFLAWPQWAWQLMYSHKGVPNRWRLNSYHDAIAKSGLSVDSITPTTTADQTEIDEVRSKLAKPFRDLDDEILACLGFWVSLTKQ